MSGSQVATPSQATPTQPPKSPTSISKIKRPDFRKSQAMVTINVSLGNQKETFVVHKNFICFYSPFFDAAFNGAFKEGETQVLYLEDASPAAFNLFVNWLYTQRIELPGDENDPKSTLIELWILGSRCLVPKIQNQSLDLIEESIRITSSCSVDKFARAYENTVEGSPLRRYLVAIAASSTQTPMQFSQDYPRQMLIDIVDYLKEERKMRAGPISFSVDELKGFYVDEQVAFESGLRVIGSQPAEVAEASQ